MFGQFGKIIAPAAIFIIVMVGGAILSVNSTLVFVVAAACAFGSFALKMSI